MKILHPYTSVVYDVCFEDAYSIYTSQKRSDRSRGYDRQMPGSALVARLPISSSIMVSYLRSICTCMLYDLHLQ